MRINKDKVTTNTNKLLKCKYGHVWYATKKIAKILHCPECTKETVALENISCNPEETFPEAPNACLPGER